MRPLTYILIILLLNSCGTDEHSRTSIIQSSDDLTTKAKNNKDWNFDKVQDSKLIFKEGQTFETNLFELEYIGQINAANKAPYLIFSGRDCNECDANISIYVHSPSDGSLAVEHGQNRYQYPGTERDYETDSVTSRTRVFYGQVLENINGVIWFTDSHHANKTSFQTVFLLQTVNGVIKDTSFLNESTLQQTLIFKNNGLCKEIAEREFSSEP